MRQKTVTETDEFCHRTGRRENNMGKTDRSETPKISVIVPVYNTENYLSQCLESIIGQTMKEIEIICVDDGSTDHSLDILKQYAVKDSRITVLTQPNINAGAARNYGLKKAKGKYLSFLDADDFFEPDLLEKLYNASEKNKAQISVCRCDRYFHSKGEYASMSWSVREELLPGATVFSFRDIRKDRLQCFVGWAWDKLFLSSFIQENDLFFQEQRTTNDMYFVFAALVKATRITVVEDVLVHQRKLDSGTLSITREKSWDCFYKALLLLRDTFQKWGTWTWMEQDFVNYALYACLWNLSTLQPPAQKLLYQKLSNEYLFELGATSHPGSYFYNQKEYNEAMWVIALPYETYYRTGKSKGSKIESSFDDRANLDSSPKVSVILPSLNVRRYIRECLDSVVNQTLREIEIICVDAGSTDGTVKILQEYAERDPRIRILSSDRKSYGAQMNMGIRAATGKYIGIVETDDYIREGMYETLYAVAETHNLDFVKADFFRFTNNEKGELQLDYNQLSEDRSVYGKVVRPRDNLSLFLLIMNTWSGIYNRQFLLEQDIWHHETPGASYQDNGFWFKTFAMAQRAYFVNRPFYMNRRDNPNSSVYSKEKVYCMNEEYAYIFDFLNDRPELKELLMPAYCCKKFHSYLFTYRRIGEEFKSDYILKISEEFKQDYEAGYLDARCRELIGEPGWEELMQIIRDPLKYYLYHSAYIGSGGKIDAQMTCSEEEAEAIQNQLARLHHSPLFRVERVLKKFTGFFRCWRDHGFRYTLNWTKQTITGENRRQWH